MKKFLFALALSFNISSAHAATLYTSDTASAGLYGISTTDASSWLIGPFESAGFMAGLAYDPSADIFYGTTTGSDGLYSINRATGIATFIGDLGVGLMHGLAFDSLNGRLFGTFGNNLQTGSTTSFRNFLYEIDTSTGAATAIGEIGNFLEFGIDTVSGLAYDTTNGVLYGSLSGPWLTNGPIGGLISIDTATGTGSLIAGIERNIEGLAYDSGTGMLYGVDNGRSAELDARLYRIDPATGAATRIGILNIGNPLGLEFAPSIVPGPAAIWLFSSAFCLLGWSRGRTSVIS